MVDVPKQQLRGVNLGGWLVLERWITPSLFDGVSAQDEYSFMRAPDAAEKIKWHRRTFMTEDDFRWLHNNGVNAVRIPVGHWLFENDDPFTATVSHLDWAMGMAERYHLNVLIDLHAAKGSQNGKDHSGRIGKVEWFSRRDYQEETITLLKNIAHRYKNSPALWGIELLNEPQLSPKNYFVLKRFYARAYRELSPELRPDTNIVYSDAFSPRLFSGVVKSNEGHPAVMDVHWYQSGKTNLGKYFKKLAGRPGEIGRLQRKQPVIVGEWSGMLSERTLAGHSEIGQEHLKKRHIEKQLESYSQALGWFYWTYKTEEGGVWDFREQVESGNLLLSSAPVLD